MHRRHFSEDRRSKLLKAAQQLGFVPVEAAGERSQHLQDEYQVDTVVQDFVKVWSAMLHPQPTPDVGSSRPFVLVKPTIARASHHLVFEAHKFEAPLHEHERGLPPVILPGPCPPNHFDIKTWWGTANMRRWIKGELSREGRPFSMDTEKFRDLRDAIITPGSGIVEFNYLRQTGMQPGTTIPLSTSYELRMPELDGSRTVLLEITFVLLKHEFEREGSIGVAYSLGAGGSASPFEPRARGRYAL
ncbi:hypothetical protein JCM10908_002247 [Rhodotorula pacifica]|uniref:uncharacterized protein n=1 Tax=Rhodotorula pacifica TaxID=1495444 RepID=UPI0031726C7D